MRAACKVFRMLVQYGKSDGIDRGTSDGISRGKTITPARENILGNREIHEIHGTSMSIFDINSMLDLFDGSISSSYEKMAFRDASSFQFQFRDHGDRFFTTRERERERNKYVSFSFSFEMAAIRCQIAVVDSEIKISRTISRVEFFFHT